MIKHKCTRMHTHKHAYTQLLTFDQYTRLRGLKEVTVRAFGSFCQITAPSCVGYRKPAS